MQFRSAVLICVTLIAGNTLGQESKKERPLPEEAEKILREKTAEASRDAATKPPPRVIPKRRGEISFDDLKFEMEKGGTFTRDLIPEVVKKLDGTNITIRGYMHPMVTQSTGIKDFILVRDNLECCFGPGAALFDCIDVKMVVPATTRFSVFPIAVKGRFTVKEKYYPDGSGPCAIYYLDATEAK
jgi:hypothetical protein